MFRKTFIAVCLALPLQAAIAVSSGEAAGASTAPVCAAALCGHVEEGRASYYAASLGGRPTATGERYDPNAFTAAHRSLPFGALVEVTNLGTDEALIVRINDRGPFVRGRLIDLSGAAARGIGLDRAGVARVRIRVIWAPEV